MYLYSKLFGVYATNAILPISVAFQAQQHPSHCSFNYFPRSVHCDYQRTTTAYSRIIQFSSSTSTTTTILPTHSLAMTSHPFLNVLSERQKQCHAACYSSPSDDTDFFVHYTMSLDDQRQEVSSVKVDSDDDVDDIKEKIKVQERKILHDFSVTQMILYETPQHKKPLSSIVKWNQTVEWGTANSPVTVKLPLALVNSKIKGKLLAFACDAAFVISPHSNICHKHYLSNDRHTKIKVPARGKSYIGSILQPYVEIPNSNGMKVLHNVVDLEGTSKYHVVVRSIMEDFWQQVIVKTEMHRMCVLGVSGIGKTSATCILIRLLLESVIYHIRTVEEVGYVYIFSPTKTISDTCNTTTIDVRTIKERDFFENTPDSLDDPSMYYVIDPGQTKDSCDCYAPLYNSKVIILAAPFVDHWGDNNFNDDQAGTFYCIPAWSFQELMACSSIMMENCGILLSDKEIRDRFYRMGGVPQHIFTEHYSMAYQQQQQALELLTANLELVERLACKSCFSIDQHTRYSISRKMKKDNLLNYVLAEKDSGKYSYYHDIEVNFISDYVCDYFAKQHMSDVWHKLLDMEDRFGSGAVFDPQLYESYCKQLLYNDLHPQKLKVKVRDFLSNYFLSGERTEEMTSTIKHIPLGGLHRSVRVDNAIQSSVLHPLVLYSSMPSEKKLCDFLYQHDGVYYIFYCTFATQEVFQSDHVYELVKQVLNDTSPEVFLTRFKQDADQQEMTKWCAKSLVAIPRFRFFYMVPGFHFNVFTTDTDNPTDCAQKYCEEHHGAQTALHMLWKDIVSIQVLCVSRPQKGVVRVGLSS
jgi:hypothetical protein